MKIKHDHHLIDSGNAKLIEAGYGEVFPHSIHFEGEDKDLRKILNSLCSLYDIHQSTPEKSTMRHYGTNWDLFFWSDRGWNGTDEMRQFTLSFNEKRSLNQNMDLFLELFERLENMNGDNVFCWVQYIAKLYDITIANRAEKVFEEVSGKFVNYGLMTGKIKIVGNNDDGSHDFGFFKKGARTRYYPISQTTLVLMNLQTA